MLRKIKNEFASLYRNYKSLRALKQVKTLDINSKPKVLNLNIIDSCNSKCTMCNIWKRDEQLEITPEQLYEVLTDPLYSELKHVGVTGGEPTLREDLPEIYSVIIDALPEVIGLSIITNAILEKEVIQRIIKVNEVCEKRNVGFSAMVSIDGLGKAHDQVRGTKGNFDTAIAVYNFLKEELGIPVSFGCTISKVNIWDADDLLYYAKKNNMYGRFRVAETINRLYNQDRGKVIRNFDEDETYNLLLFFEKLKITYERDGTYQRTYSSIQNILKGGNRLIGCPYHKNGIVLGSKGQLSYCAPKSKEIGNAITESSQEVYKNQFAEKERILRENCKSCIHDYHAPITYEEKKIEIINRYSDRLLKIEQVHKVLAVSKFIKKVPKQKEVYRVFIIGWYGTETVGDKAILGGIINHYNNKYSNRIEYVIGSLFPFVSERTCKELDILAKVVSTKTIDLIRYSKSSDEIVMGGGPLMDLNELYVPYLGFSVAKKYNNKTTVFGCGIGPLYKNKFLTTVKNIFAITDDVKLRDKGSIELYNSFEINKVPEFFGDPAKDYIVRIADNIMVEKENILTCYLRDWTHEYFQGTSEDFLIQKNLFEKGIANLIKVEAKKLKVERIEFHHMHNFVVGNDDRDFSRYFTDKFFPNDERIYINKRLSTVVSIVESMKKSKLNICMRFHSVLFAHTLNTEFLGIDYTMGGKIHNFLNDNSSLEREVTINQLIL